MPVLDIFQVSSLLLRADVMDKKRFMLEELTNKLAGIINTATHERRS